mgnify:CR=1 FL=1
MSSDYDSPGGSQLGAVTPCSCKIEQGNAVASERTFEETKTENNLCDGICHSSADNKSTCFPPVASLEKDLKNYSFVINAHE